MRVMQMWSLGWTTHYRILAWLIAWTQEPSGLQSHGVAKESDTTVQLNDNNLVSLGYCKTLTGPAVNIWGAALQLSRLLLPLNLSFKLWVVCSSQCPFVPQRAAPLERQRCLKIYSPSRMARNQWWQPVEMYKSTLVSRWNKLQGKMYMPRTPWWLSKGSSCHNRRCGLDPWVRKMPWRRKWQPTPLFLSGEFHGQRSLAGLLSMGSQRVGHDWAQHSMAQD